MKYTQGHTVKNLIPIEILPGNPYHAKSIHPTSYFLLASLPPLEKPPQRLINFLRFLQHQEVARINPPHAEDRCEGTGGALCAVGRADGVASCGEEENGLRQVLGGCGDHCDEGKQKIRQYVG